MKNIFKIGTLSALLLLTSTSCEDFFDTVDTDTTTLEDVFSNRGLTLQWLTNVYYYLPDETDQNNTGGDDTRGIWTPSTIEGKLPWDGRASNYINLGTLSPSTDYVQSLWTAYYKGIQAANIYIANVDNCTPMSEADRLQSKAEARALRSIFYFNLFKVYGPVVIIGDQVFDTEADISTMMLERSSVDDCVDYMVSEFDAILADGYLQSHFDSEGAMSTQYAGNITREAIEAVRSQVLLYAASSLFNGNDYYKSMTNSDGTPLFPQSYDESKWTDARDAAKSFIENNSNFSLCYVDITGTSVTDVTSSCPYTSVIYASLGRAQNPEMIFYRRNCEFNYHYCMRPRHTGISNAESGGGALAASLQFVDMFFTDKGIDIADDPDYHTYTDEDLTGFTASTTMTSTSAHSNSISGVVYFRPSSSYRIMKQFYNREPRFYAAFTFQNRHWDLDASQTYYTDFSYNGNSGAALNGHDYPKSGILARKKMTTASGNDYYVYIRLSEIYLNYAEACCELGDVGEAINYVNKIRARAGIPEYVGTLAEDMTVTDKRGFTRIALASTSKDDVRNLIRRERLLELAYENHRYFDVRRWDVADMAQGDGYVYPTWHTGGEGGQMMGFDVSVDMAATDAVDPLFFYKRTVWETRIFSKRMNLFPIPQTEVNRNNDIIQNAGWEAL